MSNPRRNRSKREQQRRRQQRRQDRLAGSASLDAATPSQTQRGSGVEVVRLPAPPDRNAPLLSTDLKLSRADTQIEELHAEIGKFLGSNPYRLVYERDFAKAQHVFRASIHHQPPLHLGPIIGDCTHNLRSALDNAIFELTLRHVGAELPRTEFPIFHDRGDYWRKQSTGRAKGRPLRGSGLHKVRGIFSLPILAFIESVQPYNGGDADNDLLWVLHELSNVDKHRRIHLTGAAIASQSLGIGGSGYVDYLRIIHMTGGPFEDRAEIMRWETGNNDPGVYMDHQYTFDVAFAPAGPGPLPMAAPAAGRSVVETVRGIRARVGEIVDLLRLAF